MWIFKKILLFIFPSSCFVCGKKDTSLCTQCIRTFSRSVNTIPFWIHTTYSYKDNHVRNCLHHIKYYHRKDLIPPLVQETCDETLRKHVETTCGAILVPIPMYRTRLWSRGYNHASYIAKAYSELLSLPVEESLLIRIRPSPQQAKMKHKRERERNIHNVFGVHTKTNLPKNTTIILVDDTTTTHATLYEAKRVLEKAGYTNVRAITLAH